MKLHQMYLFKCGKNPHLPFLIDFALSLDWQNVEKKKIRIRSFSKHSSFYFCKLNLPEFVNNISVLIIQRDCKRSIFFLAKVHGIFSWIIFEIHFSLHKSLWRLSTKKSWNHLHFTFACSTDQNINPNSEVSESCRSCHQKRCGVFYELEDHAIIVGKKKHRKNQTNDTLKPYSKEKTMLISLGNILVPTLKKLEVHYRFGCCSLHGIFYQRASFIYDAYQREFSS